MKLLIIYLLIFLSFFMLVKPALHNATPYRYEEMIQSALEPPLYYYDFTITQTGLTSFEFYIYNINLTVKMRCELLPTMEMICVSEINHYTLSIIYGREPNTFKYRW